MNRRRRNHAFTLAEVLSAVIVMAMATGLLMSGASQMFTFVEDEELQDRMERESTLLLDYLERDIKAAAGLDLEFPSVSPAAQSLVLKVPLFEDSGLLVAPPAYNWVAYEYFPDTGKMIRTIWADALGTEKIDETAIEGGPSYFTALADWIPVNNLLPEDEDEYTNIQVAVMRYEFKDDRFYWRTFVIESLMRNKKNDDFD